MPATDLPRIPLGDLPTPYEPAERLAAEVGFRALWIKREDLSGPALGGNKIRQIEYILGAARAAGADTVITTAASQSNFCRALAGCAARVGLSCRLLLRAAGGMEPVGNLLLMRMFGAEITFTDATDPWHPSVREALEAIADDVRAKGGTPFIVQLPGETAALAVAAWALACDELVEDFALAGQVPDILAVACGSALTFAGLALGFARHGLQTRMLGVEGCIRHPKALSFGGEAPMIGGQLVQNGERLAIARDDANDRSLPWQHVGLKIRRELKEVALRKSERIEILAIHEVAHQFETIIANRESKKRHYIISKRARLRKMTAQSGLSSIRSATALDAPTGAAVEVIVYLRL